MTINNKIKKTLRRRFGEWPASSGQARKAGEINEWWSIEHAGHCGQGPRDTQRFTVGKDTTITMEWYGDYRETTLKGDYTTWRPQSSNVGPKSLMCPKFGSSHRRRKSFSFDSSLIAIRLLYPTLVSDSSIRLLYQTLVSDCNTKNRSTKPRNINPRTRLPSLLVYPRSELANRLKMTKKNWKKINCHSGRFKFFFQRPLSISMCDKIIVINPGN